MGSKELGNVIFKTLNSHLNRFKAEELFNRLYELLKFILEKYTEEEKIHFTTLFSKIAYVGTKHKLSRELLYHLHGFRKKIEEGPSGFKDESSIAIAIFVISELSSRYCNTAIPSEIKSKYKGLIPVPAAMSKYSDYRSFAEGVFTEVNLGKNEFTFIDNKNGFGNFKVAFNIVDQNANFNNTVSFIIKENKYPVNINLLEIEIDEKGKYYPKSFVLEPDYLIDVTAIAEGFKDFGVYPRLSLLRKFLPVEQSQYLMLGNLANHFLDLLISNPDLKFASLRKELFHLNPLAFSLFDDKIIVDLVSKAKIHFGNLKREIKERILDRKINTSDIYLEPSFYSRRYGIQGRLDLFHTNEKKGVADIIELKSGKAYKPNIYGISINHYTQTLLYDLIIRSVFDGKKQPSNYILYSSQNENALRFAPLVKAQQREAIQLRNELIIIEKILENTQSNKALFNSIRPDKFKNLTGFALADVQQFAKLYSGLDALEQEYVSHFTSFIAKEQHLSKTGDIHSERRAGLASMWNMTLREKEDQFNIISYLKIADNKSENNEPIIVFQKTELTKSLNNFRVGDIAVLYPYNKGRRSSLRNQIFKCILLENNKSTVKVKLRNKQFNQGIFQEKYYWNLEHDLLDSGFNKMYQSLYDFTRADGNYRRLILSRAAPVKSEPVSTPRIPELTQEQERIFQEIISSDDYYLLWGPPGTGKTSVMLKNLVDHLFNKTDETILLLAYTNRAVDEICEAIESISRDFKSLYIRIGSRYSCNPKYRDRLFDQLCLGLGSRKELIHLLGQHRIYVSTIASILGKRELFYLKKFDRIIVDEASQILEPYLVGLLSKTNKFVLIGDHNQLPAVVVQNEYETRVNSDQLKEFGLNDMRNSLFERLFRQCEKNKWDWAIGKLSKQGRMHIELMDFPNRHFYEGNLDLIDKLPRLKAITKSSSSNQIESILSTKRLIYIPCMVDEEGKTNKTNDSEAKVVDDLVKTFIQMAIDSGDSWTNSKLGVITPFRAQIAKIRAKLGESMLEDYHITVDTVERYQGGARDIIIISFCANSESQLRTMSSISISGVDRKLNVALTRAREQIIILGNRKILERNPLYKDLIESAYLFTSFKNLIHEN